MTNSKNAENEIASADDPKIRHFKIPRTYAETPVDKIDGGEWKSIGNMMVPDRFKNRGKIVDDHPHSNVFFFFNCF